MDPKEFIALVNEMRRSQKEFFRTRSATSLNAARKLEEKVDRALIDMHRQPSLFELDGE